ncbi:MAG: ASKHA domain-containing protein [Desulfovibrionaceae bacterium]|nr:ASKHA domain-containing protein [Desulfovibrionaceae bacterium]
MDVAPGTTLLEALQKAGIGPRAECGGNGRCGKCRIRVRGNCNPPTLEERERLSPAELADGLRLACWVEAHGPVTVENVSATPDHTPGHTLDASFAGTVVSRPDDQPAAHDIPVLGLAVDLGSTKIAAYLLDLESGRILASTGKANPQSSWGADILSRIAATMTAPTVLTDLREAALSAINGMATGLCREASEKSAAPFRTGQIMQCVIVGNTVMQHLVLGLAVQGLGQAPFVPLSSSAVDCSAVEAGLALHPCARVYLPPTLSGFIGSDHLAALLAADVPHAVNVSGESRLVVDIGTNTEISLVVDGAIHTCSTASGPAFEGAHISCGMRALPGAIDRIRYQEHGLVWQSIGNVPPVGICGSGVLDGVAALRRCGAISRHGTFVRNHPLVRQTENGPEAVIVPGKETGHGKDISMTRKDVGNMQLAKAAIRCGLDLLLARVGRSPESLDEILVAGAFGTHLNIASAKDIGLFPDLPDERFRQIGNAAGLGACRMLLSKDARRQVEEILRRMTHHELAEDPDFAAAYTRSLELG